MSAMSVEVNLVEHPLVAASLTKVRDENTPNAVFRQELERIGTLLLVEATRNLATHEVAVQTLVAMTTGRILTTQPVVIPVLPTREATAASRSELTVEGGRTPFPAMAPVRARMLGPVFE